MDGENAFNTVKSQAILDRRYVTFPQLAVFVETWYLEPSPLWFYMNNTVAIIFSSQGMQQEYAIATFLFSNVYAPILEKHISKGSCSLSFSTTLCHLG